ncbi:Uncharacterised protein [Mycobacteroides abscessus subsp. abscessus]|nr:Uncharacterised protein [Mycobacteroides abscessus subsp. abscessus]
MARIPASGVRRSWDTQATSCRRDASSRATSLREAARRAEVSASCFEISENSLEPSRSGCTTSPAPILSAACRSCMNDLCTRRSKNQAPKVPMTAEIPMTQSNTLRSCADKYISAEIATVEPTMATIVAPITVSRWEPKVPRRLAWRNTSAAAVAADVQTNAVIAMTTRSTALSTSVSLKE